MDTLTSSDYKNDYFYVYNRCAPDRPLCRDVEDFNRFLALLYTANDSKNIVFKKIKSCDMFSFSRANILVDIVAYCILHNGYHIILCNRAPRGMQNFIQKISTAYTMYYNSKYNNNGTIFVGSYHSNKISDKSHLYKSISRVHLYPFYYGDKSKKSASNHSTNGHMERAVDCASRYKYSSMRDYMGEDRPQKAILDTNRI